MTIETGALMPYEEDENDMEYLGEELDLFDDEIAEDDDFDDEFDDEDEFYSASDDEDDEFLHMLLPPLISSGAKAVGRLFTGGKKRNVRYSPVRRHVARGGLGRGFINTRQGRVPFNLGANYVKTSEFNKVTGRIFKQIADRKRETKLVESNAAKDRAAIKRTVSLAMSKQQKDIRNQNRRLRATESRINKKIDNMQQMQLLFSLMGSDPQIDELTINDGGSSKTIDITNTKYEDSNDFLLPLLMMGGLGGSGDSSNMLLLAMALR